MHEAVQGVANAAVVANSDMGDDDNGRTRNGLPDGAMHSKRKVCIATVVSLILPRDGVECGIGGSHARARTHTHTHTHTHARTHARTHKVNLGWRNGLAMLRLLGRSLGNFASVSTGPVLQSAMITKQDVTGGSRYDVTITFNESTTQGMHFAGAADCTICCSAKNGSAVQLRVVNSSDPTGYTWQRSEIPTVSGNTVSAVFLPVPVSAVVDVAMLRFMYEGEPECVLYNGVGGPDNATAVAASPFYVAIAAGGIPSLVPATPCASMLQNGSCYFEPEACTSYTNVTCPKTRCCWSPTINNGQCLDKGAPCYKGQCCT
jgi:hypothetical protein